MDKIAICVDFQELAEDKLDHIKNIINTDNKKFEFVHVWNDEYYPYPGDMVVAFYPNNDQKKEINAKLEEKLGELAKSFAEKNNCETTSKVFKASSPKRGMVEYLNDNDFKLAITLVPKRDKVNEFFHASFAHYLSIHSKASVLSVN